jgi:tripartite-type tricarboxylate transporter receptor subunit TctC
MSRARFLAAMLAAFALCAPGLPAAADFPSRPIRIVVPYAPGGASETMARLVAERMAAALKTPELKDKLHDLGMDTIGSSPEEFAAFMKSESERFADAIRFSGAKAD